jgi:glutaredoxin 3
MGVVMYVKPGCPYCDAAREHFTAAGDDLEERDATASTEWKAELLRLTRGTGVVPTIVRPGEPVQVGFPPGHG